MGSCHTKKQPQKQQDIKIVEQIVPVKAVSHNNEELLRLYHRLSGLLELVGNTDNLPSKTRERLNGVLIIRSNIQIIIQNCVKRAMKEQNLLRRATKDDENLIHQDSNFSKMVYSQVLRLNRCLGNFEGDEDFENAFPILSVSIMELGQQFKKVEMTMISETITKPSQY